MNLELSDAEAEALIQELSGTINYARYPLSPRIQTLRAILQKLRPEPIREPFRRRRSMRRCEPSLPRRRGRGDEEGLWQNCTRSSRAHARRRRDGV
jgi:hypothetical protein